VYKLEKPAELLLAHLHITELWEMELYTRCSQRMNFTCLSVTSTS